jgi:hypothetical protein
MNTHRILASGLEAVTADIVASMTKYAHEQSAWTITGKAGRVESYVHADWRWLVLPSLLLVAGMVLLGLTILVNKAERLESWKSPILPLLYHGLDISSGPRPPRADTVSRMDGLAQETEVRLQESGNGRLILQ